MQYVLQQLVAAGQVGPLVYGLVLLAGIVSALSPCFVPVLALFAGYVGGYARETNRQPLGMAAAFTLGQAVVLAGVGLLAVLIGKTILSLFTGYSLDRYIPAALGLIMGLKLVGVLKFDLPGIGRRKAARPRTFWGAFTLGLPFGLVVTPCTVPIFVLVVSYVALNANVVHGPLLLVAYALGRGLILGAVALSAGLFKGVRAGTWLPGIERASGVLMLAASVYLLFFYDFSRTFMPALPGMGGM